MTVSGARECVGTRRIVLVDGAAYALPRRKTYTVPFRSAEGPFDPYQFKTGLRGRFRVGGMVRVLREAGMGRGPLLKTLRTVADLVEERGLPAELLDSSVHIVDPQRFYIDGILNSDSPLAPWHILVPEGVRDNLEKVVNAWSLVFRLEIDGKPELCLTFPSLVLPDEFSRQVLQCALSRPLPFTDEQVAFMHGSTESAWQPLGRSPRIMFIGGTVGMDLGQLMLVEALRRQGFEARQFLPVEIRGRGEEGAAEQETAYFDITEMQRFAPDVVCFSAITYNPGPQVIAMRRFREQFPEATVIVGGPFVTDLPEAAVVRFPDADIFIRGQAEVALPRVIAALVRGDRQALAEVPGTLVELPGEMLVTNLDYAHYITQAGSVFPPPALYEETLARKGDEDLVALHRFCANPGCTYCVTPSGPHFSARVEDALAHIRYRLAKAQPGGGKPVLHVMDDDALGDPDFYFALRDAMREAGLLGQVEFRLAQTAFRSFMQGGRMRMDLIDLLIDDLGLYKIHFGLDGAYQGALDEYHKQPSFVDSMRILFEFMRRRVPLSVNWIALPPYATREDVARMLLHRAIFKLLGIQIVNVIPAVAPNQGSPIGDLKVESDPPAMEARRRTLLAGFGRPRWWVPEYSVWTDEGDGFFWPLDPAVRQLLDQHPLFTSWQADILSINTAYDVEGDPLTYLFHYLPGEAVRVISREEPFYATKLLLLWMAMNAPCGEGWLPGIKESEHAYLRGKLRGYLEDRRYKQMRADLKGFRTLPADDIKLLLSFRGIEASLVS